ncbi:C-C motif chemokine 5-like [Apteryx rowi]|uniref:C-C motif chemokine 5-like n=1 Tax=Apteryx rowi TaxID=308060 RepID=UPI000E1CF094|nr:C-C motif chemokine 5-like [Apteryx rowi]
MKVSVAVFTALLIAASCSQTSSAPAASDTAVCCFTYTLQKLSRKYVKEYFYTTSRCQQPAVVFITRKNHQVCADPNASWVKEFVNFLEKY